MQADGMDDELVRRAEKLGFKTEQRADGWYLVGQLGEEVGEFSDVGALREFLDWLESRQNGNGTP